MEIMLYVVGVLLLGYGVVTSLVRRTSALSNFEGILISTFCAILGIIFILVAFFVWR